MFRIERAACRCVILALCLLVAGCGLISVGVSNSPDWCPNPKGTVACP